MRATKLTFAAAVLCGLAAPAAAQTAIEVITFKGNLALPYFFAIEKGLFAKEGLTVNVTWTPSSGYQFQNLVTGKFQVAQTAIDNQIAYMEGQGTAKLDREPDLITILGGSSIELALMAQPSIKTYADLKGKDLALDSISTGFAFVLRRMLEKNGIGFDDVKFVPFGGTDKRWEALKEGKAAASLMTEPFRTIAMNAGYTRLGEGLDVIGKYLASVHVVNRAWAKENEAATVGYIRAYVGATQWVYQPANHPEAVKIAMARLEVPEPVAASMIKSLVEGRTALEPKGAVDLEGLKNVIELREQYGQPQKKLGAPEKYFDLSYYKKAIGG
jgi:ABC-type nitrate/sulfonate/bicarbonate transport system substrate-binding protein